MKRINVKKIVNIVYVAVLVFLFFLAFMFVISRFKTPLGIMAFNVQSGSMEPKVKLGSVVFVAPKKEYKVGDVITFRSRDSIKITYTHRITRVESDPDIGKLLYYTKGDANEDEDTRPLEPNLVLGKVFLTLPMLGYPLAFAKTQLGFIVMIIIPATIIVYSELLNIKDEVVKMMGEKNKKQKKSHAKKK